jgi:TolB protein
VFDESAVRGESRYRQVAAETTGEFVYERTGREDSLTARRVTTPEIGDLYPAWSPDGRRIAFRRHLEDGAVVCVVDRDGGNLRELARVSRERDPLAWSPDGTRLVYGANVGGNLEIVAHDVRTGNESRIASGASHEWSPSFARADPGFAFCSDRDGTPGAWLLSSEREPARRLTPAGNIADLVSVSPSGKRAAWVDGDGRLILWNVSASEGFGVFEPRGVISPASWSPGEDYVVVEAFDWGTSHLYVVDANDGRALMLTHSRTGEGMPSWSPDGREILCVSARAGRPSVWALSNVEPFLARLRSGERVAVLDRPEALRSKPPDGLRRVQAN